MKKFLTFFSVLLIILSIFTFNSFASFDNESITGSLLTDHYYMMSLDDGYVVFSKNEKDHVQPAAMAKVLAAVYAIEKWGNLDESISITTENLSLTPTDYLAKKSGFVDGDSYTKLEIIETMLIYSANDAEAVIAYLLSGSLEKFAEELNTYAKSIGCTDTNIVSVFGFDEDGQYISTKDVATIISHGMKNSSFSDVIQMSTMTLPATSKSKEKTYNTGTTLTYAASPYYHSSVKGGKETSTNKAGKCIAAISNQDGYSYVTVVMNGGQTNDVGNTANKDAKTMIEWVYKNLSIKTIIEANQVVADLPIQGGKNTDRLQLAPAETVSALVLNSVSADSVLVKLEDGAENLSISAPITQGTYVCKADVIYANEVIATVDLVAASTVALSSGRLIIEKISDVMMSGFVIFLEIIALIVLLVLLVNYLRNVFGAEKEKLTLVGDGEQETDSKAKNTLSNITGKITELSKKVSDSVKNIINKIKASKGGKNNEEDK